MTVSTYMDVYGRILEYNNGIVIYVKNMQGFLKGTVMYLEGIHMYIKVDECIFNDR
jgi:hypothetical protein